MAPVQNMDQLAKRRLVDVRNGRRVHIYNLHREILNGWYSRDIISDYIVGVLLVARHLKVSTTVTLGRNPSTEYDFPLHALQVAFIQGPGMRRQYFHHYGNSFLDHDGKVVQWRGRLLCGLSGSSFERSTMTIADFVNHEKFEAWAKEHLWAGGEPFRDLEEVLRIDRQKPVLIDKKELDKKVAEWDSTKKPPRGILAIPPPLHGHGHPFHRNSESTAAPDMECPRAAAALRN